MADERSLAQQIAELGEKERAEALAGIDPDKLIYDWSFWSRPRQRAPKGNWNIWLILAGRGFGKALESSTPIPTPAGFTEIGRLSVGDTVFDHAGQKTAVTGVYPQGARDCSRVTFDDGTSLIADEDHLWTVFTVRRKTITRYARTADVRTRPLNWWTSELASTITTRQLSIGDSVPLSPGLSTPDITLPIDPYTLGAWLGDGTSADCLICGVDDEIFDRVSAAYPLTELRRDPRNPRLRAARFGYQPALMNPSGRYGPVAQGMNKTLRDWDLYKNKHVPEVYLRASRAQRLDLLRGIMDTDGTVQKTGLSCGVGFVNRRLRDDVSRLLHSLGVKHQKHDLQKGVARRPETVRPFYTVDWRPTHDDNPFYLERKASRVVATPRSQATRKYFRRVVSIESVGPRDATCISVSSESSLFLAGEQLMTTHNTRTGAEWIKEKAEERPGVRIGLVGRTAADVRDVMINGESGIMSLYPPGEGPDYKPSNRKITWPNGSTAMTYSATEPDQLRGPQFEIVWADETAAWNHVPGADGATAIDNIEIAARLGSNPQILMTTTPKRVPFLRELLNKADGEKIVVTNGSTADNAGNLHSSYLDRVYGKYAGTSLGAQELDGVLMDDVEGALWSDEIISRVSSMVRPPLVVIGVDPSVAENPKDECGIVVVGATRERQLYRRQGYVLEDASVHGSPAEWSRAVVDTARRWNAPVVAEVNQGGAMVAMTINALDSSVPVFTVHSRVGKSLRAEPIAGAYEQGRVHHLNRLVELEDQMTSWVPGETRKSPDRIDALVHGLTALMVAPPRDLRGALGTANVRAHAARGTIDVRRRSLPRSGSGVQLRGM